MGYQIGVTPLQMAAAVSCDCQRWRTAHATRRPRGDRQRRPNADGAYGGPPGCLPRHGGIADRDHGAGRRAREPAPAREVPGFTAAGKTGTSQKVVDGRYSRSEYTASFVGFVPSRQPAFTIVVVIDSPHGKNLYYGGSVAGTDLPADRGRGAAPLRRGADRRSTPRLRFWSRGATFRGNGPCIRPGGVARDRDAGRRSNGRVRVGVSEM